MDEINFCRACLVTDVKIYCVKISYSLKVYLKLTTDFKLSALPLCNECVALFKKCEQFRDRCMKATSLLKAMTNFDNIRSSTVDKERRLNLSAIEAYEIPATVVKTDVDDFDTYILSRLGKVIENQLEMKVEIKEPIEDDVLECKSDKDIPLSDEIEYVLIVQDENAENDMLSEMLKNNELDLKNTPISGLQNTLPKHEIKNNNCSDSENSFLSNNSDNEHENETNQYTNKTFKTDRDNLFCEMNIRRSQRIKKLVKMKDEKFFESENSVELLNHEETQTKDLLCKEYGDYECAHYNVNFEQQSAQSSSHDDDDECKNKYSCKNSSYVCYSSDEANTHAELHVDFETEQQSIKTDISDYDCNEENDHENSKKIKTKKTSRNTMDLSHFEGYATIVSLTAEQAKNEMSTRLETPNYVHSKFKCDLCFRGFERKESYENHMKKHSPDRGDYECEFCHLRFSIKNYLNTHILRTHKRKFFCEICPFVCYNYDHAKVHVNMHKGSKFPCDECGEMFSLQNSMLNHKRTKHANTFVCDICGDAFGTERGLNFHKKFLHGKEANPRLGPVCELCDLHFANEAAWKKHLVVSAMHHVSNGCKHCGEIFESASALKNHSAVHVRKRSAWFRWQPHNGQRSCTTCGEVLKKGKQWKEHTLTEHPESSAAIKILQDKELHRRENDLECVCEVCGKSFMEKKLLKRHMLYHTGKKRYMCSDCGKSFSFKHSFLGHQASKHGMEPQFRCRLCPKTFIFSGSLYKHLKVHFGIRPYKCEWCDKSFATRSDMRPHVRHTHLKVPWPKRNRSLRPRRVKSENVKDDGSG